MTEPTTTDQAATWDYDETEDLYAERAKVLGLRVFPMPDGERYLMCVDPVEDDDEERTRDYRYRVSCKKSEWDGEDPWFFPQLFGCLPQPGDPKKPETDTEHVSLDLSDEEIGLIALALHRIARGKTVPIHNAEDVAAAKGLLTKLGFPYKEEVSRGQA